MKDINSQQHNRRQLLKIMGMTGGALAATSLFGSFPVSAATGRHNVLNVATIAGLNQLEGLVDGDLVFVGGYSAAGDGGAKFLRWVASSTKTANGGTVHDYNGGATGRFEVVHEGVGDFRWFGIFDSSKPADDAFDALASDLQITCITAHSDLSFKRRHQITRSNLTLDFGGNHVYTTGIAAIADPSQMELSPLFLFTGSLIGSSSTATLTKAFAEYTDVYEVPAGFSGAIEDWYLIQSNANPAMVSDGRGSAIEIQRMAKLIKKEVDGRCCFNYRPGYSLATGRTLTYQKVSPIENITVKNIKFHGNGNGDTTGCHPVTFLYGVHCNVSQIDSEGTFAAAVMRMYNTHYITEHCTLTNPSSLAGGRGYLTQQMYCNYGIVRNCQTSYARHLNDFTGSSYMLVENCHANYDYNGGFVTHGQFEHDLTYTGNSGLMSFANSKKPWASSAKNITVKRHTGCNLNAGDAGSINRITNLTIEDCDIFEDGLADLGGKSRVNGVINLNCDGLSVKNCTCSNMLYLLGVSSLASRPNVIENSSFSLSYTESGTNTKPYFTALTLTDPRISQPVTFRNCTFTEASGRHFYFNAPVIFENCVFEGNETAMNFASYSLSFIGCKFKSAAVSLEADNLTQAAVPSDHFFQSAAAMQVSLKDCIFIGSYSTAAIAVNSASTLPVLLEVQGVKYTPATIGNYFIENTVADTLIGLKMRGCTITGGKTNLASGAASYFIVTDNFISSHTFENVPAAKVAAQNVLSATTGI